MVAAPDADQCTMYRGGAADDLRNQISALGGRRHRLTVAVVATVLAVGGTITIASAATNRASASDRPEPAALHTARTDSVPRPAVSTGAAGTFAEAVNSAPVAQKGSAPSSADRAPSVGRSAATARVFTAVEHAAVIARPTLASPTKAPAAPARPAPTAPGPDTCGAALSYLAAHAAPGFTFECPGYALGRQAMTCVNVTGVCPGISLIAINVVCPASYMNEAHNSWILSGRQTGSIDPYGYCH